MGQPARLRQHWFTVKWYGRLAGGVALDSTANLTTDRNYYAESVSAVGCTSATRTEVTVTIFPNPETASGSDVARCDTGEITLSATPGLNGNAIRWYNAESNGNLEYTGNDLTRNFDSTTTYYAESYNTATGCAAEQRKEIRGIVVTQAQINQNPQNSIICNNGITSFFGYSLQCKKLPVGG
jgi:hypothetical protein